MRGAGLAVDFSGVALISLGEGEGLSLDPGALLVLIAAVSSAGYFVISKPYLSEYTALESTTYALWVGTIPGLVFLPVLSAGPATASLGAASMVYLGLYPTAVAYMGYAYVLSRLTVSRTMSFLYLVPAVAFLVGSNARRDVVPIIRGRRYHARGGFRGQPARRLVDL